LIQLIPVKVLYKPWLSNLHSEQFWAGWDDEKVEGSFASASTGEILNKSAGFWPFHPGEPNGDTMENCVVVWPSTGGQWNDYLCSGKNCGFCHLQIRPRFKLRGEERK
jgi:hypothetical protein